jgi:hypothetical protein
MAQSLPPRFFLYHSAQNFQTARSGEGYCLYASIGQANAEFSFCLIKCHASKWHYHHYHNHYEQQQPSSGHSTLDVLETVRSHWPTLLIHWLYDMYWVLLLSASECIQQGGHQAVLNFHVMFVTIPVVDSTNGVIRTVFSCHIHYVVSDFLRGVKFSVLVMWRFCQKFPHLLFLLLMPINTFMQSIYTYVPQTNHVSMEYSVAAIL